MRFMTFRYRQEKRELDADLAAFGIWFTELVLPTNEDLGCGGFCEWKATACHRLDVESFFVEMPEGANGVDPNVLAFVPFDADPGRLTYLEKQERHYVDWPNRTAYR